MFCQPGYDFFQTQLTTSAHNYLEIGVFNGDSVAGIARNHLDKSIYGIDPFIEDGCTTHYTQQPRGHSIDTQRTRTYNDIEQLTNVILHEVTSKEFSNNLTDQLVKDMNVGWVLIDGSHHYEDVAIDVKLAMRLIGNKTGGIVFDDLNLDGPKQAHAEFLTQYQQQISGTKDLYDSLPKHIIAYFIN